MSQPSSQKPSVNRTVHFHFNPIVNSGPTAGPYAATITAVNDDGSVDLVVFGRSSMNFHHNVCHRDDPARPAAADFWDWAPRV